MQSIVAAKFPQGIPEKLTLLWFKQVVAGKGVGLARIDCDGSVKLSCARKCILFSYVNMYYCEK